MGLVPLRFKPRAGAPSPDRPDGHRRGMEGPGLPARRGVSLVPLPRIRGSNRNRMMPGAPGGVTPETPSLARGAHPGRFWTTVSAGSKAPPRGQGSRAVLAGGGEGPYDMILGQPEQAAGSTKSPRRSPLCWRTECADSQTGVRCSCPLRCPRRPWAWGLRRATVLSIVPRGNGWRHRSIAHRKRARLALDGCRLIPAIRPHPASSIITRGPLRREGAIARYRRGHLSMTVKSPQYSRKADLSEQAGRPGLGFREAASEAHGFVPFRPPLSWCRAEGENRLCPQLSVSRVHRGIGPIAPNHRGPWARAPGLAARRESDPERGCALSGSFVTGIAIIQDKGAVRTATWRHPRDGGIRRQWAQLVWVSSSKE